MGSNPTRPTIFVGCPGVSTKALVVILMTFLQSGSPSKAMQADPPQYGFDLRVRELRTDRVPGSWQLTFTVAF